MNCEKLKKVKKALDSLQGKGGVKAVDLESIAKKLERKLAPRGKEPNWVSDIIPNSYPISIPHHGNRDLRIGTKLNILNSLNDDYERLMEIYECNEIELNT